MKKLLAVTLLVLAGAFAARPAMAQTLFPANDNIISIFGETGNGNVDSQPTQHNFTTTTTIHTTTTVIVANPNPVQSPTQTPTLSKNAAPFKTGTHLRSIDPTQTDVDHHHRTTDRLEHNVGGGGILFGHFWTRYIGTALEGDFLGGNPYDTALIASVILRYPFEFGQKPLEGYSKDSKTVKAPRDYKDGKDYKGESGPTWGLAPYLTLGGGVQWDGRAEGVGAVGVGVEVRFKQHWGVFVESRWIAHDSRQNYFAETGGISYNF
jgi:hypothetical protein